MRPAPLLVLAALLLLSGCENRTPPPSPSPGPGNGESITGRERLGWDQQASSAAELAAFRYAIYVDGVRFESTGVSCGTTAGAAGFTCSGQLPPMSAGTHTLELATFTVDGGVRESARSSPLRVFVTGVTPSEVTGRGWIDGVAGETVDGVTLHVDRLLDGFLQPSDAAFAPDGRLFVAERAGRILILAGNPAQVATALLLDDLPPDGGLLAIALHPEFVTRRTAYVLSTSLSSRNLRVFRLARYRELAGVMAQRAILLETPAPADASAAMRFGPDGMLYVAFGSGSVNPAPGTDMGKVLRLNPDGTAPRDRRSASPVISSGHVAPSGLAWRAGSAWLWLADGTGRGQEWLAGVSAIEEVPPVIWPLPPAEPSSSLAYYGGDLIPEFRGDLLLGSIDARQILRVRFAADDPARVVSTEPLLRDQVGAIRVVLSGPDGAIYFLTDQSLGRIRPGPEIERR
ncbi:hypothetical protein BH23ACI1_BH23ACI1_09080 [soil metagenome]